MNRLLLGIFALLALTQESGAAEALEFKNARVSQMRQGTTVTAGFVEIKNSTGQLKRVKFVEMKPFKAVELHETVKRNGMASMKQIPELSLKAGETIELKPGSFHLMLFEPIRALRIGGELVGVFDVDGTLREAKFKVTASAAPSHESPHESPHAHTHGH